MTEIDLSYLHKFKDRHGQWRYYFRYKGRRWTLPAPDAPGFATAYDRHLNDIVTNPLPETKQNVAFLRGSLGWAIEKYLASDQFRNLADATQRNHRRVLDILKKDYGTGLLKDLTSRHCKVIRNKVKEKHTTTAADIALGLISTLWEFADEQLSLDLDADPTHGVRRVHKGQKEHEPWPQELIDKFLKTASAPLRLAVQLLLYTGQRRSDVVKMKWSEFDGEFISVRQQKGDERLDIPCHKTLRAVLEALPRGGECILLGSRGEPYGAEGLSVMVRRQLKDMKINGYSVHGLRKNAGNALAEAGCSTRQIMAVLGHRTFQMAMHYTKKANQRRLARSAMDMLEAAESGKPKNVAGAN